MPSVAIQMDPIGSINPKSDTSLLLGLEAQARGYELWYYTPDKLSLLDGKVTARAERITLFDNPEHYYELGESKVIDLSTMNVVLLRQDPPFNMTYLSTTYLLDMLPENVRVVNNPTSVRNLVEKLFPMQFQKFMPPTLVTRDLAAIEAFREAHKDIVIKPVYGFGGRAVLRLKPDDDNFHALMEMQFANNKEPVMVQPYLPEVATGDRRIVLIDGEIAGIFGRIPAAGDIRANMRVGGMPVKAEMTAKQREICEALKPVLKAKNILLAGVDTIGDWLTEINITSPTGLRALKNLYGTKPEALFWDAIHGRS